MKALLVTLALLLAPSSALGKTFICDVKGAATFTTGTFKPIANESYWLNLIKAVTFDEDRVIWRPPVLARSKATVTYAQVMQAKELLGLE